MRSALLLAVLALTTVPAAYGTGTLSFANDKFEIQIVISDVNDEFIQLRLYGESGLLLSVQSQQAEIVHYDPAKGRLHLIVPASGSQPRLDLIIRGKNATMTYGAERVKLKGNWKR